MSKELHIGKYYVLTGIHKGFGLGFCVTRYQITIDFLCFYIAVEL